MHYSLKIDYDKKNLEARFSDIVGAIMHVYYVKRDYIPHIREQD